jgi:hypothetical protein
MFAVDSAVGATGKLKVPHHLTIFTFFWACQALVHQEFYWRNWLPHNLMGWVLTGFILATLAFPRSLALFSAMLISSIIYNIGLWPYVVNHIVLESIINFTILLSIGYALWQQKTDPVSNDEIRTRIIGKLAPVLILIVILMYWFIVNSKSNYDFFSFDRSCIADFYLDVLDFMPYLGLPKLNLALNTTLVKISLWIFILVEVLIPLFLMFRKTRYIALIIGVPFHMLLAMIGHRTFSGFILALYVLICVDSLAVLFEDWRSRFEANRDQSIRKLKIAAAAIIGLIILGCISLYVGYGGLHGVFKYSRYWFFVFFFGSVGITILFAIFRSYKVGDSEPTEVWSCVPKWIWLMMVPVIINGASPFIGLKTETSFAMYSNIRTEGGVNNHMFMPVWRLAGYQDDLINILDSNHPQLKDWIEMIPLHDREMIRRKINVVYFEFNRIISESIAENPEMDFYVTFTRNGGEPQTFRSADPNASEADVAQLQTIVLRKLLFFRPVFVGKKSYCQH